MSDINTPVSAVTPTPAGDMAGEDDVPTDPMERGFEKICIENGIRFERTDKVQNVRIDYYLPDHGVYVELKQYHSDRIAAQMKRVEEIIVIQGRGALQAFGRIARQGARPVPEIAAPPAPVDAFSVVLGKIDKLEREDDTYTPDSPAHHYAKGQMRCARDLLEALRAGAIITANTEIAQLTAERDEAISESNKACDSYALENQRLSDENDALLAERAGVSEAMVTQEMVDAGAHAIQEYAPDDIDNNDACEMACLVLTAALATPIPTLVDREAEAFEELEDAAANQDDNDREAGLLRLVPPEIADRSERFAKIASRDLCNGLSAAKVGIQAELLRFYRAGCKSAAIRSAAKTEVSR